MKTTTERLPVYVTYGVVTFNLKGNEYHLNVYQNQDINKKEANNDYLFLPFLDNTNGEESYGGGRYIDLKIPVPEAYTTMKNPYANTIDTENVGRTLFLKNCKLCLVARLAATKKGHCCITTVPF